MSIAVYLKEIGRGKEGARSLSAEHAHDLFSQVLDRTVTDLEVGAFALAMRIKGETTAELQGFVKAAHERCMALPASKEGIVILPSYNGARKLPNLTALLAAQLARSGVSVLVHGPLLDPSRITTAQVWQALGWQMSSHANDISHCWTQNLPAFMPISSLCPSLSALLDVRWTIGLRNPGHTVAKLLCPWPASIPVAQVVNHTHPEYALSLTDYLMQSQGRALLMRGTEGEPVADARRQPRFDAFIKGERHLELSCQPQEGVLQTLPVLPDSRDADITANHIQDVLAGRQDMPNSIKQQADCLVNMLKI
jgi:anthranilate phosphoribosyltransferase